MVRKNILFDMAQATRTHLETHANQLLQPDQLLPDLEESSDRAWVHNQMLEEGFSPEPETIEGGDFTFDFWLNNEPVFVESPIIYGGEVVLSGDRKRVRITRVKVSSQVPRTSLQGYQTGVVMLQHLRRRIYQFNKQSEWVELLQDLWRRNNSTPRQI